MVLTREIYTMIDVEHLKSGLSHRFEKHSGAELFYPHYEMHTCSVQPKAFLLCLSITEH